MPLIFEMAVANTNVSRLREFGNHEIVFKRGQLTQTLIFTPTYIFLIVFINLCVCVHCTIYIYIYKYVNVRSFPQFKTQKMLSLKIICVYIWRQNKLCKHAFKWPINKFKKKCEHKKNRILFVSSVFLLSFLRNFLTDE